MRATAARCGPRANMNPLSHWNRDMTPDFEAVIDGLDASDHRAPRCSTTASRPRISSKRVKEEDLGLSINISTSIDGAEQCCHHAGIPRHSVGYSLGFEGKTEKLPNSQVLMLSTMCGHGMVSHSLAKKMIDWVKEGRRTPERGRHLSGALLLLRRLQSGARENEFSRAPSIPMGARSVANKSVLVAAVLAASFQCASLRAEVKVFKNFTLIDGTGGRASEWRGHDRGQRKDSMGRACCATESALLGPGNRSLGKVHNARDYQPPRPSGRRHRPQAGRRVRNRRKMSKRI